jgi:prophage DNA circulation protein
MSRDWAATLWPASFKGVPFWAERDKDVVGKRLAVHEFPGRDDPFIEDLGAKARTFDLTAYFVDDDADIEADAFIAAVLQAGPGVLVLPAQGPINARAHLAERERIRDRAGYFGIQAKFYKEGAAVANAPSDFLQQIVFDAGDALVGAATSLLSSVSLS